MGLTGYLEYYLCALGKKSNYQDYHTCVIDGPGSNINFYVDIPGIVL